MKHLFLNTILTVFFVISVLNLKTATATENSGPIIQGHTRFTVISPEVVRIEYHPRGIFIDQPSLFAVKRRDFLGQFEITRAGGELVITTSRMKIQYRDDGQKLSKENLSVKITRQGRSAVTWSPELPNTQNLGGTRASLDYAKFPVAIDDGVLSREGWFWLDDSMRDLTDETGWIKSRADLVTDADRAAGYIDGYLFAYDRDYKAALKALITVGGEIPIPRRTVFGSWYSRWWAYSSDDFRQIVKEFADHDFPLDNLVMDLDWHIKGWGGYSWNRKLLPDAEGLLKWLGDSNIKVVLNDHPDSSMVPQEDEYPNFMRELGRDPASGEVLAFDGGDRHYVDAFFKYAHGPRNRDGVGIWWLDWMGDHKKPFNTMPWISRLFYENSVVTVDPNSHPISSSHSMRGQGFARWGGWGSHRYPIHFSGDTIIKWSTLENLVPFTAMAGNMGAAYWSHDIGGFIDENPTLSWPLGLKQPELTARWAQFAAFSPIMRLHSVNFWYLDKRPWLWGSRVEQSMKAAFQLRARLVPYIYSHARFTEQTGVPLVRPLYLDWPANDEAYKNSQEYLFGDAFLVAPITKKAPLFRSESSQKVWFPSGDRWFDWFSGEEKLANSTSEIWSDLNQMPLFARGGYPIIMQPYSQRPTSEKLKNLNLRIFPGLIGQEHQTTLYEDDGKSLEYKTGVFSETKISYTQLAAGGFRLVVAPTEGSYERQKTPETWTIELPQTLAGLKFEGLPSNSKIEFINGEQKTLITVPSLISSEGMVMQASGN